MRKTVFPILLLCTFLNINANSWLHDITQPKEEDKPWTFWYWMFGAVSHEAIVADLQAMKQAGIGGFYLMPIKGVEQGKEFGGTAEQLSPEWWKCIDTVYRTADSLNLEMGVHFSDGFALGGGPWISAKESMQKVVFSDTIVSGGKVKATLPMPERQCGYYEDIAVYAIRDACKENAPRPMCSATFPIKATEDTSIVFSFDKPFTLRGVKIVTGGNNYQAHRFRIYASMDGVNYQLLRQLSPNRQGWQNTDAQCTYAVRKTTAKNFKFVWQKQGSEAGAEDMDAAKWKPTLKVADIVLLERPVVDSYEGKSALVWRVSENYPLDSLDCAKPNDVINLTQEFTNGTLSARLPKGKWRILRFGHTSTGHTNATGGGGKGLECDKFSPRAIEKQFNSWFRAIKQRGDKQGLGKVLTRFHIDSWECGSENWGERFREEFQQRRGYDIVNWLPLFAGVPMESGAKSDAVLRDVRETIGEIITDVFYNKITTLARQEGCTISAESVAPTMVSDGMTHYKTVDYPMGEFWLNSPTHDKPNDMLDAISGAHQYGKNRIQAEGFTELRGTWDEHFATLKPLLDRTFAMGINALVFHINVHNPYMDRQPGMTLDGIGTFFQRDNTWWSEMPALTDYISRCQRLLRYGKPVVDLAVYTGDEMPRRSILPERLVSVLPGLFGEEAVREAKLRAENLGQPMEQSPVGVSHTKNITRLDDFTNPLRGYAYDSFNHDALSTSTVTGGKLRTLQGMEYAALIVPGKRKMNPNGINTAQGLIKQFQSLGLPVIEGGWAKDDLSALGIKRDIDLPQGISYTHRTGKEADIYFVANGTEESISFEPKFRAERKKIYIFDAMNGELSEFHGKTTLAARSSLFYILTDEAAADTLLSVPFGEMKQGISLPLNNKEWCIEFSKTGRSVTTDTLFDWSKAKENDVKYYSGSATYTTFFTWKAKSKAQKRVMLRLGDVRNIATVYLNGQKCGTTWLAPHQVEITKALNNGENRLEIVVVNTWANALLGKDLGTPPFDNIWTNGKYRRQDKTPLSAGLLGEVTLEM